MATEEMAPRQDEQGGRAVVYCLVPRDLAPRLHEPLRRHFRDDPRVEVVVERRQAERRIGEERRAGDAPVTRAERRRIRNAAGRRVGERRATHVDVPAPPLPRRAQPYADRLLFAERIEPPPDRAEDLDSARLVTRVQAGDRDVFSELYMRYFDRLYSYLHVALRNPHDAEDATQQVFMQAMEALPRYERRRPFRAWLFVIARNYAVDRLRAGARYELQSLEAVEPGELLDRAEVVMPTWLSDRDLVLFVERLPLLQRQVLVLRYMLGLSVGDVAEILDLSPNHVSVLQHRALAFLRRRLSAIGRGPERPGRARARGFIKPAPVLRARRFSLLR